MSVSNMLKKKIRRTSNPASGRDFEIASSEFTIAEWCGETPFCNADFAIAIY
jgi:hypothetical protein